MSTLVQQDIEPHTLIQCGYCGKGKFTKLLIQPETSYVKNCVVCKEDSFNHKKCAYAFAGQLSQKESAKAYNIGTVNFGLCKIPYHCQKCMQKECFSCSKKHSQRKYFNLLYYIFLSIKSVLILLCVL